MMGWTSAGGFAERSRTVGIITQDGDRRRSRSNKHAAQLASLRMRLGRYTGEHDLLRLIVADLSKQNLDRATLILTDRPHVTAVNGEHDRFCHLRGYAVD
jgi:hypothetical protein